MNDVSLAALISACGTVGAFMLVYHLGKRVGRREERTERHLRMAREDKLQRLRELTWHQERAWHQEHGRSSTPDTPWRD